MPICATAMQAHVILIVQMVDAVNRIVHGSIGIVFATAVVPHMELW